MGVVGLGDEEGNRVRDVLLSYLRFLRRLAAGYKYTEYTPQNVGETSGCGSGVVTRKGDIEETWDEEIKHFG